MQSGSHHKTPRRCPGVAPGAALILLLAAACLAGPLPSSSDSLPRPSWWDDTGYQIGNAGKWDLTLKQLEIKYAEPKVSVKWSISGPIDCAEGAWQEAFDMKALSFADIPDDAITGDLVHVDRVIRSKKPGAVCLKAEVEFSAPASFNLLIGTRYFVAVYQGGKQIYRAIFDGERNKESMSVPASFPAGKSAVFILTARRPGACSVSLRIGRVNFRRQRIGFLATLQKMYPTDREHVLAAQKEICRLLAEFFDDHAQTETEYRRLYLMAEGDVALQADALSGLAAVYSQTGRYHWAVDALRERLRILAASKAQNDKRPSATIEYADAAADVGELDGAVAALQDAIDAGGPPELRVALGTIFARYTLFDRAKAVFASLDDSKLPAPLRESVKAETDRMSAIKPNSAYLDLNHTATEKLGTAKGLADGGAYDRAATALVEALDAPGRSLAAVDGCAVGISCAAGRFLSNDAKLAAAYRSAISANPVASGAPLAEVLARRPCDDSAQRALRALAVDAASRGRYALCALAVRRLLSDFAPTPEVQALASSPLAAADDKAANAAGFPAAGSIEIAWSAPLAVRGTSADAGTLTRPGGIVPRAAGAVYKGKLYAFDGAKLEARDMSTGKVVFSTRAPLAPGVVPATADDITMRAGNSARKLGFIPPATVCVGGDAVYFSMRTREDGARNHLGSMVAAVDASDGHVLWATRGVMLGEGVDFVSPPTWAYDRVYVIARSSAGTPNSYLACLDAVDGSPVFLQFLGSCEGFFAASNYWGSSQIDAGAFAAAPAVSGDTVLAAPNMGALFSVDAISGIVRYAWTYPRAYLATPSDGVGGLLARRGVRSPTISDGTATVATNDSAEVFSIVGGKVKSAQLPGAYEVIGAAKGIVVCAGDLVYGIDPSTGATVWKSAPFAGGVLGGIVRGDAAYVPSVEGLTVYSVADGKQLASYPWPSGTPRGNLIVSGDSIVAFGESDVAVLKIASTPKGSVGATQVKSAPAVAQLHLAGGAGLHGLWAVPAQASSYLLAGDDCPKAVFAKDGKQYALTAGQPIACWDITGPANLIWSKFEPFRATNAAYSDGKIFVSDEWTIHALNPADGNELWRHETRELTPVETATVDPIATIVFASGRLMYSRSSRVAIVDTGNGETVCYSDVHAPILSVAGGTDFFAVAFAEGSKSVIVRVYSASDGEIRAVRSESCEKAEGSRVTTSADGRIYLCCPSAGTVDCIDGATGKLAWRHVGQTKLDRLTQFEAAGGLVAYAGPKGEVTQYVVLSSDTGNALRSGKCVGKVGLEGDSFWVVGNDLQLCRYNRGAEQPTLSKNVSLEGSQRQPFDWLEHGGFLYALLGDDAHSSGKRIALAKLSAATGEELGLWDLPVTGENGAVAFESTSEEAFTVAGRQGVLRATWGDASTNRVIPVLSSDGAQECTAEIGGSDDADVRTADGTGVVIDGDLSDWGDAKWQEVKAGPGDVAAQFAFGASPDGFAVAVRTFGEKAGGADNGSWRPVRIEFERGSEAGGIVFDMDCVPTGVAASSRANAFGGRDYEMRIPWGMTSKATAERNRGRRLVSLAGRRADGSWWVWPESARLPSGELSLVEFGKKGI